MTVQNPFQNFNSINKIMTVVNIKAKKVSDLMSRNILTGHLKNSFAHTLRLFAEMPFHHLPIVNGKTELVGMLSSNDMLKTLTTQSVLLKDLTLATLNDAIDISEIMTLDPKCISPDATIKEALEIFCKNEFHALPVVKDNSLVGIITTNDLLKNSCRFP